MESGRKHNHLTALLTAVVAGAILWFYGPVLWGLVAQVATDDDFSFGLMLPLVSGYIVYQRWPELRQNAGPPAGAGLAVMGAGFLLYIAGELGADLYLPRVSFLVVLAGLALLLGGWPWWRRLAFPLALLWLMVPLPGLVTQQLTFPLQLMSSRLAVMLLRGLGTPVALQGNIIDLGTQQLQVVEACAGLRLILVQLSVGLIYGYFFQRRGWKAAVLMISLVPTVIFANGVRLAALGLLPALRNGWWHTVSGLVILVLCFYVLELLNRLLNYLQPQPAGPATAPPDNRESAPGMILKPGLTPYLLAALVLVAAGGPMAQRLSRAEPVGLCQSFAQFPLRIGDWQGVPVPLDPEMARRTQADEYVNADFRNGEGEPVSLWIAYYASQRKAGGFVHSPRLCLTGAGWRTEATLVREVAPGHPVKYLVLEQGGRRMLAAYWYLQRGRWLTHEYLNKLYMSWDGLAKRRTDGALIRLITPGDEDLEAGRERLAGFARSLTPILARFIP